jgi:hypothetical protein
MFKISKTQLGSMEKAMHAAFELRVIEHLRKAFPDIAQALTDADLLQLVRSALARASSHGLFIEWNLLRFVEYALMLGLGFEDRPEFGWVHQLLHDAELNDTEKMNQIEEHFLKYHPVD